MKSWLKAFWEFMIEPWASALALLVMAIIMGQLLRFMFYLGGRAEERETAVWRGLAMEAEPEQCALCTDKIWIKGTYPCLFKLATGEVQEIWVHNKDTCELTLTSSFGTIVTGGEPGVSSVTLPENQRPIDPALFCRDCRTKLAEVSTKGYVLADLYDLENIQAYAVTDGAVYDILGYTVEVTKEKDGLTVEVTGYSE